nr:ORF25 [Bracoviriform inaniti]
MSSLKRWFQKLALAQQQKMTEPLLDNNTNLGDLGGKCPRRLKITRDRILL